MASTTSSINIILNTGQHTYRIGVYTGVDIIYSVLRTPEYQVVQYPWHLVRAASVVPGTACTKLHFIIVVLILYLVFPVYY